MLDIATQKMAFDNGVRCGFNFNYEMYARQLSWLSDKELEEEYKALRYIFDYDHIRELSILDNLNTMEVYLHEEICRRFFQNIKMTRANPMP